MSQRVPLSYGLSSVFLILLAIFGLGMIGIGLSVAVFAGKIHAAQPDTSELQWYVAGAITTVVGVLMFRPVLSQWGAVAAIDVDDDDGSWALISRFNRVIDTIDEDDGRGFELHGVEAFVLTAGVAPQRRELVRGTIVFGDHDTSYRLAQSSPEVYDEALSELGYEASAPRPGQELSL